MKTGIVIILAIVVVLAGWWLGSSEDRPDRSYTTYKTYLPDATITDPAAVFQKAFWKRPTSEDQITHAERREWADKDGLSKWQWFISLKPSPAIVDYLITQNAFSLTAAPSSGGRQHAEAPEWFPTEAPQTFTNATGTFTILWDKKTNLLHATDSGTGFRPGAPAPIQAITATQPRPPGRLPTTPPPKP
jgi:hypothetical protein